MTLTGNPTLVNTNFNTPPNDPLDMLREWLNIADKLGISEPRGMVLATVNNDNRPSSRVVLIKECDEKGVIFSSSEESAKGKDLKINPWASGTLWWRETLQQINFQGQVFRLSAETSDLIFQQRPRDAQAVAIISNQSEPLVDEQELRDRVFKLINQKEKLERPKRWKAYHFVLESIEFWHGSMDRFHKRLRYDLINGFWQHKKLQP